MKKNLPSIIPLTVLCLLLPLLAQSADWPQYRMDAERTGYTEEALPGELTLVWKYVPEVAPEQAWIGQDTRMDFDRCFPVVAREDLVYFGNGIGCKVSALNLSTGKTRWEFYADAPVRLAPAVWRDRLFFVSDDGVLYCLNAVNGELIGKKRGGPDDDLVLGNRHIVSRWPSRGGPAIRDDVLYCAFGIWPSEGIFIDAMDPNTGEVLWRNEGAGCMEMDQPHPGARADSGVSVQGYIAASSDTLLIPTGRAQPAAFDIADGTFRYFYLREYGAGWGQRKGAGSFITVIDDMFASDNDLFGTSDGRFLYRGMHVQSVVNAKDHILFASGNEIKAVQKESLFVEKDAVDRKGNPIKERVLRDAAWSIDCGQPVGTFMVMAGDRIVVGAGSGAILVANASTKTVETSLPVDGVPLAIAIADGNILVSTDKGTLYCFGKSGESKEIIAKSSENPFGKNDFYSSVADEILEKCSVTEGYCVDLGCGDGRLAYELARKTELKIYAVTEDAEMADRIRKKLNGTGLYGARITVLCRALDDTSLPNYMADLIVSEQSAKKGVIVVPRNEVERLQRPYGGMYCIGKRGRMESNRRGPLPGAAAWSHQYANAANTLCSTDEIVHAPLKMLWFDDNDFEMPSRHGRGPAPLFGDGRLYVEGMNGVRALDAYNGRVLWEYPMPGILAPYDQEHLNGAAITGSNFCIDDDRLFVFRDNKCHVLNSETGEEIRELTAPASKDGTTPDWGYLAAVEGILYGSLANEEHVVKWAFGRSKMEELFSESILLFAMDPETGEVIWTFSPEHSIRHNAVAIGDGKVFLIDRPVAEMDISKEKEEVEQPFGRLIALDAKIGKILWTSEEEIFGTMLAMSEKYDVLLMAYQNTTFKLSSEIESRLAVFDANSGTKKWDSKVKYGRARPLVNDRTIYAQPGAWDLLTGEQKPFELTRSYGCGILAGSTNLLAYRSATLGYWDLEDGTETINYGGIRPGCWVNVIPAGGLLLVPETANRCTCSYLIKASIALQPAQ